MIEQVREKCELFTDNYSSVHKKFLLEANLMSVAAALIQTLAGRAADPKKMAECRKILEKKTGILSNFRLTPELVLVSSMTLAEDPTRYLDEILSAYKKISKGKFLEDSYIVIAAILICDFGKQDEIDNIITKSKEIMERMNSKHPVLTSSEDLSLAMFLALSYKDVDTIIKDIDEGYDYLKNTCKVKASSNAVQELCEVLAVSYGDMKEKCDKVLRIYSTFSNHKAEYGSDLEFASLGSLIDIGLDPDSLVREVIEAEEYLKDKGGNVIRTMEKKQRMMYAALLVADACGSTSAVMSGSVLNNTVSMLIAKRISTMISVILNGVSLLASAASKDGEE